MYDKKFSEFTAEEKSAFAASAKAKYEDFRSQGLCVNMARGNPSKAQLELSGDYFTALSCNEDCFDSTGLDCRGYGTLAGTDDCRKLFADILGVKKDNVIACGSSSLNLMFDFVSQCMTTGAGDEPWMKQGKIKFLAVCPGYDRHFGIAKHFGIELVNVKMTKDGPDMDAVEELIKDSSVKGMFCVPKYSNPSGNTYTAETVERLAKMTPAAKDFRVIWDNAYIIHDLYADDRDETINIFDVAAKYGHEDNFVEFASTSKITFPGAGVAVIAASDRNIEMILGRMKYQIISYDKLNQMRHVRMFKDVSAVMDHMAKHADLLRPKFEKVLEIFGRELGGLGVAEWSKPKGGYFISLDVTAASAKRVGELCKAAGLTLTNIGATFPDGIDPEDKNIRIAPSFPPIEELEISAELLCAAIKYAICE